jgi:hypothetical protein
LLLLLLPREWSQSYEPQPAIDALNLNGTHARTLRDRVV